LNCRNTQGEPMAIALVRGWFNALPLGLAGAAFRSTT
jgi:hypothetical protein